MGRKFLGGLIASFAITALTLPADAGRRHYRSDSTTCGRSAGSWYHFTSGSGNYVPFASESVTTSHVGVTTHRQVSGQTDGQRYVSPAVHHTSPGCRNCTW